MRTFGVALVSSDSTHAVDSFYKYRADDLPEVGQVIDVVRFIRGRAVRARVTRVDANGRPEIEATQVR